MRPLRYSINITLDGCCDHRGVPADAESHGYWAANLEQADALPVVAGHGPTLFAGLREPLDLELVERREFRSGAVALRYQHRR